MLLELIALFVCNVHYPAEAREFAGKMWEFFFINSILERALFAI